MNSLFHLEITTDDTSYFFANSASVSRSLTASNDTRALNSALNFLLVSFISVYSYSFLLQLIHWSLFR